MGMIMHVGKAVIALVAVLTTLVVANAREISFAADDDEGLAVVGVRSGDGERFELTFARYVPETQKLDAGSFSGHTSFSHEAPKGEFEYHVFKIKPGTHVFKSLSKYRYRQTLVMCLNKGTYAFDIHAGEAAYLGDFSAFGGIEDLVGGVRQPDGQDQSKSSHVFLLGLTRREPNLEAAKAAVAVHPEISVELKTAELRPVTFINGRSLFGDEVCGGYY